MKKPNFALFTILLLSFVIVVLVVSNLSQQLYLNNSRKQTYEAIKLAEQGLVIMKECAATLEEISQP